MKQLERNKQDQDGKRFKLQRKEVKNDFILFYFNVKNSQFI